MNVIGRIKDSPILLVEYDKYDYRFLLERKSNTLIFDEQKDKNDLLSLLITMRHYLDREIERVSDENYKIEIIRKSN